MISGSPDWTPDHQVPDLHCCLQALACVKDRTITLWYPSTFRIRLIAATRLVSEQRPRPPSREGITQRSGMQLDNGCRGETYFWVHVTQDTTTSVRQTASLLLTDAAKQALLQGH